MPKKDIEKWQRIRDEIKKWDDHWKYNVDQYNLFTSFVMGSQWQDDEARLFENYKKIPLQVNKLAGITNHLIGQQRQNTPSLQIEPEEFVPEQTAEVRGALVKNILLSSNAKVHTQTAFQQAVIGGFSALRAGTQYTGRRSFNQEIIVDSFNMPQWCYWDVGAKSPSKTDGMQAGFRLRVSRRKFRSMYGKKIERQIQSSATDDSRMIYVDDDSITMIYHYERTFKDITLYLLTNDRTITKEEMDGLERRTIDGQEMLIYAGEPVAILNQRQEPDYKVKFYLGAGDYTLEEEDFPSEQLPIIFVDQNSYYDKKGKQVCRPFMKDAKDAQRYLNYIATQSAYILKVSRFDQFMASKNNVKSPDTQNIWRDPQTIQGALIYDESSSGAKPERLTPPELSRSLMEQYERALRDIHECVGVYDTQLGQQGNEVSGKAVERRTERGSFATYMPFSSIDRALGTLGEVINEMIPKVYDTERELMLEMPDRGMQSVMINKEMDDYGLQYENDMREGRYKIRLMPGASIEGQKDEARKSMENVLAHNPELFNLIADLYVESLPLPNNIQLRNRLRTIVPPDIIKAGKTGEPLPPKNEGPPPEVMMMMKELELKEKELAMKQREIEQKIQLQAQEMQQDAALEWQKLETERLEAAAKLKEMEMKYLAETHRTNSDISIAHANNLIKLLTHTPKEPKHVTTQR